MQAELAAYQRGEITFERFMRDTGRSWHALAQHLLSRWKAPPGVSVQDIEQELLVACWKVIPKYDPARGVSLQRFVIYNACDKAKKWLHKQRNAYRRDDRSPSRVPVNLSSLGLDDVAEERVMSSVACQAGQEDDYLRREALAGIQSDDLAFMHYQRAGTIEQAAANIQASRNARLALQTPTLDAARAAVERSIERAAEAALTV